MSAEPEHASPHDAADAGGRVLRFFARVRRAVVPAVLLLALLITMLAWHSARQTVETAATARFHTRVAETHELVRGRMEDYAPLLRGAAALFTASQRVDRSEWRAYLEALKLETAYPGIDSLGFLKRLGPDDIAAHNAAMHADGLGLYAVFPPGQRAEYFPVTYAEPMSERNVRTLGRDHYVEDARHQVMDRSRDTGEATLSPSITLSLARPGEPQTGVVMYLPVYRGGAETDSVARRRQALVGFVFARFRTQALLQQMLSGVGDLRVEIFDGPAIAPERLLYDSGPATAEPLYANASSFPLLGHRWTLRISALPTLTAHIDRTRPHYVLAFGIAITLLLTALAWMLATARDRAMRLAERMTANLQQSRDQLNMALEGSNLALFDYHMDDGTVVLSESWNAMLGGPPQPTLTTVQELQALVHPDDAAALRQHLAEVLRGTIPFYRMEHRVRTHDGHWKWIASRAKVTQRDAKGRAVRITGTNADISERKAIEEMKDEFISTVSHELRTPLTSIIGGLALMKEESAALPEESQMLLGLAYDNAERLAELVNDILDYEKLQSGRMVLTPKTIELGAFLQQALRLNAPYAEKHGARFRLDEPVPAVAVVADESRLMQVMTNLLSNAAKFSPQDGTVCVRASMREERVRVEVADQGPGIPEEFKPRIFSRFAQATVNGEAPHGGSGLGLAISKAIVEASGGEIGFESEAAEGTTFWFELPVGGLAGGLR